MKTLFSLLLLCFGSILVVAQDAPTAAAEATSEATDAAAESAASLYNQGLTALKSKSYSEGYELQ